MAKRTNIIRIIKNEIEKGNIYVSHNGNFVSKGMKENGVKEQFIKELRAGTVDVTTSFEEYQKNYLGEVLNAQEVLDKLIEVFKFEYKEEPKQEKEEPKQETKTEPKQDNKTDLPKNPTHINNKGVK